MKHVHLKDTLTGTLRRLVRINLWYTRQPEWKSISQGLWGYVMDILKWHVEDRIWIDPIHWEYDAVKHGTRRKKVRRAR